MPLIFNLGIGGLALSALTTIAFLSTSSLSEPEAKTLSEYTNEINKYEGKLGGIAKNRLILVSDVAENKEWWNWVYQKILEPTEKSDLYDDFKKAVSGYSEEIHEETALNQICRNIYAKGKTEMWDEKTKPIFKNNVIRFCVRGGSGNLTLPSQ